MKSASERPVVWPLKVKAPLVGRLLLVSMLVWIQFAPTENWCFPRMNSRSSATWMDFESKYPGFTAPNPTLNPFPVTVTPV